VNFSINDVEWCPHPSARQILASAASNGNIIFWDVTRDGQLTCFKMWMHLPPLWDHQVVSRPEHPGPEGQVNGYIYNGIVPHIKSCASSTTSSSGT
jgi:WD40 repeat protein